MTQVFYFPNLVLSDSYFGALKSEILYLHPKQCAAANSDTETSSRAHFLKAMTAYLKWPFA